MRRHRAFGLAAALCLAALAAAPARGQEAAASRPGMATSRPALSPTERQQKYVQLHRQAARLFADRKYEEAAAVCRQIIELVPGAPEAHYNLACALARLGRKEDAFAALARAAEAGFSEAEHMKADEDLAALRDDRRFADLVKAAAENAEKGAGFPYDKGADMPGVKTVEDAPEGGLRYRLRMDPNSAKDRPSRLIVWLHPAGGYGNTLAEPLAPMFVRHGWALLVFTQKEPRFWSGTDFARAMKTVKDVGALAGIDANRPILIGFSAGGQAALIEWADRPGGLGGLVLDAAYPVDTQASGPGRPVPAPLPKDPAVKGTPIFVAVGELDGGSQLWKKVHADWLKAGVPLEVRYVPGRRHEWLFNNKDLTAELEKWLAAVSAGKLPANQPATAPASAPALPPSEGRGDSG